NRSVESFIISLVRLSNFESALSASYLLHRQGRATARSRSSAGISIDLQPAIGFPPPSTSRSPPKASADIRRYYFAPFRRRWMKPLEWPRAECRLSDQSSRLAEAFPSACNIPQSDPSPFARLSDHDNSECCSLLVPSILLKNSRIGREN